MAVTTEIAPNVYRISIFAQQGSLQFNHFRVKDDDCARALDDLSVVLREVFGPRT